MAKFIELTEADGKKGLVNIDHISRAAIDPDDGDMVIEVNNTAFVVKESYDQVKAMLMES